MIEKIINIEIMRNPVNWAIVFLMIALAGIALPLFFTNDAE